ncbi:MAG TPA: hypothetical protein VF173_02300 [Thermoanaerobaculia bacterium]|nr:hypothetical protein [Thermoanaerobaculia bacterium]
MTPAGRNVWLEITAVGLFLISLVLFLVAGYYAAMFIVIGLLPSEQPVVVHGVTLDRNTALVAVLATGVPGAALIAAAWGLRSLLVEEKEE